MVDIFTNIYMYYIVKSFCLTEYLSIIKGKYEVLNKIRTHRACSSKEGNVKKCEKHGAIASCISIKPKAAKEFSQRIAQQYSYDLELELH